MKWTHDLDVASVKLYCLNYRYTDDILINVKGLVHSKAVQSIEFD